MEKVIFLIVIVVLSVLHNWWTKRQEQQEEGHRPPGPPPRPRPPPPLRPGQGSAPTQTTQTTDWQEELRRMLRGEEPRPPAPPPIPAAPPPRPVARPRLVESAQAHPRASHLDEPVAPRLRHSSAEVVQHTQPQSHHETTLASRQAVSLLRDRQSQRAALIAGIILGPPKAMER